MGGKGLYIKKKNNVFFFKFQLPLSSRGEGRKALMALPLRNNFICIFVASLTKIPL